MKSLYSFQLESEEFKEELEEFLRERGVTYEKFEVCQDKPKTIIDLVCRYFKIPVSNLKEFSKSRYTEHRLPRQICFYLLRKYTDESLNDIARLVSDQGHDTVLSGIKVITNTSYLKNIKIALSTIGFQIEALYGSD